MKQSSIFSFFAKVFLFASVFNLLRFMSNDKIEMNLPYLIATALTLVWFYVNAFLADVALKRETEAAAAKAKIEQEKNQ